MQSGEPITVSHRQHGDAHSRVLFLSVYRKRPKVWWGPSKNNQDEQQAVRVNLTRHSSPAQKGRRRTG